MPLCVCMCARVRVCVRVWVGGCEVRGALASKLRTSLRAHSAVSLTLLLLPFDGSHDLTVAFRVVRFVHNRNSWRSGFFSCSQTTGYNSDLQVNSLCLEFIIYFYAFFLIRFHSSYSSHVSCQPVVHLIQYFSLILFFRWVP